MTATLEPKWIDALFARLTVRYGSAFLNRWTSVGVDLDLVKADWAQELAGFNQWPEAIKYALEHLDAEKPPTAQQFRAIALKAPRPDRPALPEPLADPDRVKTEITKLRSSDPAKRQDPKDWARRILARHEAGEKLNPTTLRFAREALNISPFKFAH
jgi:hypothetical protein